MTLRELLDKGATMTRTPLGCRVVTYHDEEGEHIELSTEPELSIVPDSFDFNAHGRTENGRVWPAAHRANAWRVA